MRIPRAPVPITVLPPYRRLIVSTTINIASDRQSYLEASFIPQHMRIRTDPVSPSPALGHANSLRTLRARAALGATPQHAQGRNLPWSSLPACHSPDGLPPRVRVRSPNIDLAPRYPDTIPLFYERLILIQTFLLSPTARPARILPSNTPSDPTTLAAVVTGRRWSGGSLLCASRPALSHTPRLTRSVLQER